MYVLNIFLQATKYKKNTSRRWYLTSLHFFWHLLRQNWSIIRGTAAQCDFKLSEEFETDDTFLQKQRFDYFQIIFKDSLCLEKLTNLDANGKRCELPNSIGLFYNNILLYMNGRLSKIPSVHTNGVRQIHVFARHCNIVKRKVDHLAFSVGTLSIKRKNDLCTITCV